jgi:hypothetical protein
MTSTATNRRGLSQVSTTYLIRPEAAQFLTENGYPVSKLTLQKYATTGGGPIYRIFGNRALSKPTDLLAWAESNLSAPRCSTSVGG